MQSTETVLIAFIPGMIGAYLAGSINFSILLFRILGKGDPRDRFSGNPGVTNVYRQAGWPMAALVLLLDAGRAVAVALAARHGWNDSLVPWAGFALIMGNHFPCFHAFKGGKGVANCLGFYTVLVPVAALWGIAAYGAMLGLVRIPFLASFAMLAVLTGFALFRWWSDPVGITAVVVTMAAIVWFHRGNISGWLHRKQGP